MELDLVWEQYPPDMPNVADIIEAHLKKKIADRVKDMEVNAVFAVLNWGNIFWYFKKIFCAKTTIYHRFDNVGSSKDGF